MTTARLTAGGALSRYPYTVDDLRADYPGTGFFTPLDPGTMAHYRMVAVEATPAPAADLGHDVVEAAPQLVDGVWTQQWVVTPVNAGVLAQRQAEAQSAVVYMFTAALEAHYDAKASERRYDTRYTCALRAGYAGPFQAEGTAFAQWMDACNAHAYTVLAQVQAGQRAMPATPQALIAELPKLEWPA
jgi:hypothetical protein